MKSVIAMSLVVVCTTYLACDAATHWHNFRSQLGWTINMGYLDYARNSQDCASFCLRDHSTCTVAVYYSDTQRCYHYIDTRPNIMELSGSSSYFSTRTLYLNLQNIKGWFAAYNYYMDQYATYTYNDAAGKCRLFGGRLMNQTEYQQAYNEGEHMCNCGWLEGGTAMYASQYANYSSCTFQGTGIGVCNTTLAHACCAWLEGGVMMYGSQAANVTGCGVRLAGLGSCSDTLAHAWCVPNYSV